MIEQLELDSLSSSPERSLQYRPVLLEANAEQLNPKWGIQQVGYIADTLASCHKMQLKMKGNFRLKLNAKMGQEQMIIYGKPKAIAAMKTKVSFRKMLLRNPLKRETIDVEINPTSLEAMRFKQNVELIEKEQ